MGNLKKQTKFSKKQVLSSTSLILLLTLSVLMVGMQSLTVDAQSTLPTYAFIAAEPNPIGVGQTALVRFWTADPLPSAVSGIGQHRSGYLVSITKPDGTVDNRGPFDADYLNTAGFSYVPQSVGTYIFNFSVPAEVIYYTWDDVNNKPANPNQNYTSLPTTASTTLTVQQNPVQTLFQVPYPTQYWTRPIYAQNYFWQTISSNWLMAAWNSTSRMFDSNSVFVPEGTLANSAHILWTKPMTFGGLAGGIYGNVEYYSGMSYEQYFSDSLIAGSGGAIIIGGRVYYTTIAGGEPVWNGELGNLGTTCVDLNTGETLFTIPNVTMSFGQIFNFHGPNQAGTFAYLWNAPPVGVWTMYDAWTGNKIAFIANVTSGSVTFGKNGELMIYGLNPGPNNGPMQLTLWNSTKVFNAYQPTGTGVVSADYSWRPYFIYPNTLDGNRGIQWTVPANVTPAYTLTPFLQQGATFEGNNILAYETGGIEGVTNITSPVGMNITAYDMTTGRISYTSTIKPNPNYPNALNGIASFGNDWEFNGHLYNFNHYTLQWLAYDVKTGNFMWASEPGKNAWAYFGQANSIAEAYGLTIALGFDGYITAWDTATGNQVWQFYGGTTALTPYGHHTFYNGITVIDGKVIALPNEHGNGNEPLYQNLTTTVLDARTGNLVWDILGYFEHPYIADGIFLSHNNYDNQIYAFGKGPSATTVTVTPGIGNVVTIQGYVTDQSPGALAMAKKTGAPYIPAISDADQTSWMEELYMQQVGQTPRLATGVDLQLRAIDTHGTAIDLPMSHSDVNGYFASEWTPPHTGLWTIVASFSGTNSYYGSYGEASIAVSAATGPIATASPQVSPTSPVPPGQIPVTTWYLIAAALAVIIIVVVIAAVILTRRRR